MANLLALLQPGLHPRFDAKVPAIRSEGVQRDYFSALLSMVRVMEDIVRTRLLPDLQSIADEQRGRLGLHVDAPSDDVERKLQEMKAEFELRVTTQVKKAAIEQAGDAANSLNKSQVESQLQAVGLGVFQDTAALGDILKDFDKTNAKLVDSLPDDGFKRITDVVSRGLAAGSRSATMAKEIAKELDISKARAKLIARDQVATLNGQLTRQRHLANGIKFEIWRTAGDERVRPDHEDREGQKYSIETGIDGEFPGQPIACRCFAEPVFGEAA